MQYHIAFDVSHKPRGKIDENLTELRDSLEANDFVCYNFLEVPITEESLMPYDILVFVCPDFARLSSIEITSIVNWVKNSGGGLLLLSHAGEIEGVEATYLKFQSNLASLLKMIKCWMIRLI